MLCDTRLCVVEIRDATHKGTEWDTRKDART
jgi:hypothetical protein